LSTGGGKTRIFTAFAMAELACGRTTVIAVNRQELLRQTYDEFVELFGYKPVIIEAGSSSSVKAEDGVYIAMVETLNRRPALLNALREVATNLVNDECHINQFAKILNGWKRVIGFTATPQLMSRKEALADYYKEIYVAADITKLIAQGHLLSPLTYAPKSLVFDSISKDITTSRTSNDFDIDSMTKKLMEVEIFSDVLKNIKARRKGRTVIYNASIVHSRAINEALCDLGYESYHLDGETPQNERELILTRLKHSPEAIVNNVNVLTFGFNERFIETIIINRLTKSENLFIQMAGRGARLAPEIGKENFILLDLYGNCTKHGLWEDSRDWEAKFKYKNEGKPGEAPVKLCPQCEAVVPASAKACPHCGHIFDTKDEEAKKREEELILVKKLDKSALEEKMKGLVELIKSRSYSAYYGLHKLAEHVLKYSEGKEENEIQLELMIGLRAWVDEMRAKGDKKTYNQWHKDLILKIYKDKQAESTK
jgi:superfamily II DNA or RNA helicase